MKTSFIIAIVSVASALWVNAQGMPAASRDNIHKLFDNHAAVARSVTVTITWPSRLRRTSISRTSAP